MQTTLISKLTHEYVIKLCFCENIRKGKILQLSAHALKGRSQNQYTNSTYE